MSFCTRQLFQAAHQMLFLFQMITWIEQSTRIYNTNGVSIIGDDSYCHCRAVCVHACTRASMGAVPVIASTGPLHITDLPCIVYKQKRCR